MSLIVTSLWPVWPPQLGQGQLAEIGSGQITIIMMVDICSGNYLLPLIFASTCTRFWKLWNVLNIKKMRPINFTNIFMHVVQLGEFICLFIRNSYFANIIFELVILNLDNSSLKRRGGGLHCWCGEPFICTATVWLNKSICQ